MYFKQLITALALLCLFTMASLATASYADNLQAIEVSAEKIEPVSVSEVNLDNYNGFESIVTREAFENRLVNLADVINTMPSVQTFSTGGMGAFSSVSIRGSTGKQVNIFVDGILLNSPVSGFSNPGIIPVSIIEAIEVYPDYTPVQLSDGNLAGAINIRTRKLSQGNTGGKISAGYGSFNTWKTEGSVWGGNSTTDILLAGSVISSDNDFPVSKDLFPNVTVGESTQRQNAAFDQSDLFGKLKHALSDELNLNIIANYSDTKNEIPTIQNKTERAATLETEDLRLNIGLESDKNNHNWGARIYTNLGNNLFTDIEQSIAMQSQQTLLEQQTLGSILYLESILDEHTLNSSLDINQTLIEKHNQLGQKQNIQSSRDKVTAALSDTWSPLEYFALYGLVRGFYIVDESDPGTANFSASCASTNESCLKSEHHETSWQLGSSYDFNAHWRIKSNIGQQLRIPTLTEKYGELGNYIGEPDLNPETSNNVDAGILFRHNHINSGLTIFSKDIKNGIYISYDARGVGHPDNISKSQIHGMEINADWLITELLTFSMNGYAMDSENQSEIKADQGKKMQGIYHQGYFASFIWSNRIHSLGASYHVDDDMYYTPSNSVAADKKDSVNIVYTLTLHSWTWNLEANNILNNRYSDFNRMPNAGSAFNTSLHYEF